MFKFTEVAICKGSVADHMDYHNPNIVKRSIQGDLQILLETTTGMMMFKMKDFEYGINPNDQILFDDTDKQWRLMLCLDSNPQNVWILKIKDNTQLLYFILSQRCKLIHRKAAKSIVQGTHSENKPMMQEYPRLEDPERLKYTPQIQQDKKPQSTQSKLIQGSKTFAKFLAMAGSMLAKGLQAIGTFISKRVDPAEAINVSPETKIMIQKSVGASKKLLEFSTQKIANIFRLATGDAKILQSRVSTSMPSNEQPKETMDSAKHTLRVGLQAITNIYDGYAQGYDQATKGLNKGANHIISAKYGRDAGDAALKIGEGVRNVYKLPNVANDAIKKVLIETAKNQFGGNHPRN